MTSAGQTQLANYFTDHYGISNISAIADAAFNVAAQTQQIAIPLAGLALLILGLRTVTHIFIGDGRVDMLRIVTFFGSCLFLGFYSEIMGQALEIVQYFSDSVDSQLGNMTSGNSLASKYTDATHKQYQTHPASGGWGFPNLFDWIISFFSGEVIVIARAITYCIREVSLMFLMAVGPFAIVISMFPKFEDGLSHWFKHFIAVSFWGITLGILDRLFEAYLDNISTQDNTDGFIPMTICLTLMYCMAPLLTSKFINQGASAVMSRVVGYASRTVTSAGSSTSRALTEAADKQSKKNAAGSANNTSSSGGGNNGGSAASINNPSATIATAANSGSSSGAGNTIKRNSNIE